MAYSSFSYIFFLWVPENSTGQNSNLMCQVLWKMLRFCRCTQRKVTYFIRRRITVWLTTCLTGLDLAKQVNMLLIKHKQSNWIKTSQIGGLMYSDTSPYKVHGLNIWVETFASCWKSQSCETFQTFNPLYFLILIVEQCNSGFGLLQLVAFNDFTLQKLW